MGLKIDLHIHTNISDGNLSPKEIIDMAFKNKVDVISITDHDSIDAYSTELFEYANSNNIIIIPGIEISTKYNGVGVHILGYNIDIDNLDFKEKLKKLRNVRHSYLEEVGVKLKELGFIINIDELKQIEAVTKSHIALDIINNPLNEEIILNYFNHIPNKGEFIEGIMNKGCPAYVKKETISPMEASSLIRSIGGKVVIAHPMAYYHEKKLDVNDILEIINEVKPDGIEANYIYINSSDNTKINDSLMWKEIAKNNNLVTTIGSDFHCDDNVHPKIGLVDEELVLDNVDEIVKILKIRKK